MVEASPFRCRGGRADGHKPRRAGAVERRDIHSAARELWVESVGAAVALRDDGPVGIISERDVVAALAGGADPDACTVAEAMTPQILEAKPNDRVLTAMLDMIDHGIRHLPVFDEAGRCQAIVSMRDLLRPMLIDALEVER